MTGRNKLEAKLRRETTTQPRGIQPKMCVNEEENNNPQHRSVGKRSIIRLSSPLFQSRKRSPKSVKVKFFYPDSQRGQEPIRRRY